MDPLTVSISDAAKALGVGRTTIYKLIEDGLLATIHIGRRQLVKTASIRRLIDQDG